MRVLLLSEQCNPDMASTPYFAYKIVSSLARRVDEAVLVTQVRNREVLTRIGAGGADVEFIDTEHIAAPLNKLSKAIRGGRNKGMTLNVASMYPAYLAFERGVWKKFGGRLRAGEFDVVHRVTPLSPTLPSPIARRCPVPFVIGPVNGGLRWPKTFASELRREREWMTHLRQLHHFMPYYSSTYKHAAGILAGFQHTIDDLPAECRSRCFSCSDVGFDDESFPTVTRRPAREQMTVLYAGRLVPYKCADIVVRAFAASDALRKHRLVMVGDGPDRQQIESLIREHNLHGCIEMLGWVDHAEVTKRMSEADVFAFPSIRELGAGVVVEAMGAGMVPVVVDYGGPAEYIDTERSRGIKVPLSDKAGVTAAFVDALESLANDAERRCDMGVAAFEYVKANHSWDKKAERIAEVYEYLLGKRSNRPAFH